MRIHPFFWIIAVIPALRGESTPPAELFSWIIAVVISIVIHELGHAFMQRRLGGHPRIVLHGLGGLAICSDCDRSTRSQILISLAGPGAGFACAALVVLGVSATGHPFGFFSDQALPPPFPPAGLRMFGLWWLWEEFSSPHVNEMLANLLFINILWGAVNLLPIYPLDGGHVSRELCQIADPRGGIILSLRISLIAAIGMAIVGLSWQSLLVVLMFGYLAYSSYKTLEAYRSSLW